MTPDLPVPPITECFGTVVSSIGGHRSPKRLRVQLNRLRRRIQSCGLAHNSLNSSYVCGKSSKDSSKCWRGPAAKPLWVAQDC